MHGNRSHKRLLSRGSRYRVSEFGAAAESGGVARAAAQVVEQRPLASVLLSFSIGAGVGMAVTLLLMPARARRWYERIPDALGGRWVDSMMQSLPESIRSKIS